MAVGKRDVGAVFTYEVETANAGNRCTDYVLTKLQHTVEGCVGGSWSNYWGNRNQMTYEDVIKFMEHNQDAHDIVTIRNRRFTSDLSLSGAITLLRNNGYAYADIHCSFCRSAQFVGSRAAVAP